MRWKILASVSAPITTNSFSKIWTDGRLTPDDALLQASAILRHHLDVFVHYNEEVIEFDQTPAGVSEENIKLKKLLNMSVNEIELSVRAANCLNNANITTVGQLAQKTEAEMLKYRNFGKKSLNEIKDKLQQLGLSLGMKFDPGLIDLPVSADGAAPVAGPAAGQAVNVCAKIAFRRIMRHQKKTIKLGRTADHRKALLANQVCALIEHQRIKTTLAKAKAVRPLAERMVTLGKNGSIHARRTALAMLRQKERREEIVRRHRAKIGRTQRRLHPNRQTRPRKSDSARMAFIEWVDAEHIVEEKPKKKKRRNAKRPEPKPKQTEPEQAVKKSKGRSSRSETRGTHRATYRRTEAEKAALVRTKVRRQLKLAVAAFVQF